MNEELKRLQAIRRSWQWPSWLKAAAIVKNTYGAWWGCEFVPQVSSVFHGGWEQTGAVISLCVFTAFEPPACDDWRDSLRVNPNREGGSDGNV